MFSWLTFKKIVTIFEERIFCQQFISEKKLCFAKKMKQNENFFGLQKNKN
jgi:hypothetical protein